MPGRATSYNVGDVPSQHSQRSSDVTSPDEETGFELQGFPVHRGESDLRSREPVEILASQFVEELRQGRKPSIEIYARRYPRHAHTIRDSFPMLALLEQARSQNEAAAIRRNMPERFPFHRLGRCELLCEIGRGGMGVVFQGRESGGHIVAVKVLPWRVAVVPEWQRRFEAEARIAAGLRHRNIVPVYRFGQEHGYCYYVMQFVNGVGLDSIIERLRETEGVVYQDEIRRKEADQPSGFISSTELRALTTAADVEQADDSKRKRLTRTSWKSFTQIAIQTAQALRHAHSAGILHNDIKPANILLDASGRVWISDFGLSQPIDQRDTTVAQRLMGTLRYMAPERFLGTHDATSDLYSLGITLYELATLVNAWESTSEDKMVSMILEQSPPAPRQIQSDIPKGLETIILNCIARHPTDRYSCADDLLNDLLKFSHGQKVSSTKRSSFSGFFNSIRKRTES
ncbi:MAG: serine/threonine-protein kinase [Planctomycetaceae bacterium]